MSQNRIYVLINGGMPTKDIIDITAKGADGLVFWDAGATRADIEPNAAKIKEIVSVTDVPITAFGGVGRFEDVKKLIYAGADKVVVDTSSEAGLKAYDEAVARFGKERVLTLTDYKPRMTGFEAEDIKKALDTYIKITQQFPDDYRGWWGIFTTPIEQYFFNGSFTDVKGSHLSNAFSLCPDKNILTEYYKSVINRYGKMLRVIPCKNKVSLALVNNFERPVALDNFSSWLIFNQTGNARFYPNFFMGFISNLSNMYVDGIK